jgi:hypothetical protein
VSPFAAQELSVPSPIVVAACLSPSRSPSRPFAFPPFL